MRTRRTYLVANKILSLLLLLTPAGATAAWQMLGPFGGAAQGVRVADQNDMVAVFTRDAQLFVSYDRGAEWKPRHFPFEYQAVMHTLVIDPQDARLWLAGIEHQTNRLSGLYRTADAGETWEPVDALKGKAVWSLAVSVAHPGLVVAGTGDGVYRSVDRGRSWNRISPESYTDLRPVVSLAIGTRDAGTIIAGTTHLPWLTTDGGQTWRSIHAGMLDDSDVFSVVIHPRNPGIVYASACSGAYRSVNGGAKWARLPTPRGTFRTYVVAVDPTAPNTVYAGTSGGLLRSVDEGRTWSKLSDHAVHSIDFERSGSRRAYFASPTAGILMSGGGGGLRELSSGFTNRQWVALVAAKSDLFALSAESHGSRLYRTSDAGRTWSRLNASGMGNIRLLAEASATGTLYSATRKQVFKSGDRGETWKPIGPPVDSASIDALAVSDDQTETVVGASGDRLYRLTSGNRWIELTPQNPGRIRTAGIAGRVLTAASRSAIAFSRDGGATWQPCRSPSAGIEWYEVVWTAREYLFSATSHGLLRSADCVSWTIVRNGLDASTVSTVFAERDGNVLFAAQRGKLHRSLDAGSTWAAIDQSAGVTSMPTRLVFVPGIRDRIFGLFARRGAAAWLLEPRDRDGAATEKPLRNPETQ